MTAKIITIICLANSIKNNGFCVAGIELNHHSTPVRWIRLIGNNHPQGLTVSDYRYRNGDTPQVFDVINIPVVAFQPLSYHVENWLIDTTRYWYKRGEWDVDTTVKNLSSHIYYHGPLWINGYSSSTGANNRIPEELFDSLGSSLQLIIADDVKLYANKKYNRVDAYFGFADNRYVLSVTDPQILEKYSHISGEFNPLLLGRCMMTISLGEPYQGFAYKLAAHIMPLTPAELHNE
ncbi:MAG: dual OB domain-containing protein [Roseiflexaceae bacterium]